MYKILYTILIIFLKNVRVGIVCFTYFLLLYYSNIG